MKNDTGPFGFMIGWAIGMFFGPFVFIFVQIAYEDMCDILSLLHKASVNLFF